MTAPISKFTPQEVKEMRQEHLNGKNINVIAKERDASWGTICTAISGKGVYSQPKFGKGITPIAVNPRHTKSLREQQTSSEVNTVDFNKPRKVDEQNPFDVFADEIRRVVKEAKPDPLEDHFEEVMLAAKEVMLVKNEDYAVQNDPLHRFKEIAKETGIQPRQVWYVYFGKHLGSIKNYIAKGKLESESLRSRIIDLINYLVLLDLMASEEQSNGS